MNPTSEEAEYDPQAAALSSAYTAAINHYLRSDLKYGENQTYVPNINLPWDLRHGPPNGPPANQLEGAGKCLLMDLAACERLKSDSKMKVLLAGGYFDLATQFFKI